MANWSATGKAARTAVDTSTLVALRAELEAWETAAVRDPVLAYHERGLGQYLTGLRALAGGHNRLRAALLVALALGPRTGGLPGDADVAPLLQAATQTSADIVDLGIAWGCGWLRT